MIRLPKVVPLVLLIVACIPRFSFAVQQTTLAIEDTTALKSVGGKRWFGALDLSTDLAFRKSYSGAGRFGILLNGLTLDVAIQYSGFPFRAVAVHRSGDIDPDTLLSPEAEARRNRDGVSGHLFSMGVGVGGAFRLFESRQFIELLRFGMSYARYGEEPTGLNFIGALANFYGGIGYKLDPFLFSLGVTWNLGWLQRVSNDRGPVHDIEKHNFLPIQWWAFQASGAMFVF